MIASKEISTLDEMLQLLRKEREAELRNKFDRSLPFADAISDRWERARSLGFKDGVSIYDSAYVYGDVDVDESTWIGPNVVLDGTGGGIQIGSTCSISAGVHIYTHDTVLWALSGGVKERATGPVTIGDCTYIGPQSIIAAGVSIGSQCVIGANSFVNADVPDKTFVAGSPAGIRARVEGEGANVKIVRQE